MVLIHKELERNVKKLKRMKKEFMQWTIKTEYELPAHGQTTQDQSTWGVVVVINQYSLWLWRIRGDGDGGASGEGMGEPLLLVRVEAY